MNAFFIRGMGSMFEQNGGTQADDLIVAVQASGAAVKVWQKGRKRAIVNDVAWREALAENMQRENVSPVALKSGGADASRKPERLTPQPQDDFAPRGGSELEGTSLESILRRIRSLSDDPEKLLESHLGIFIEPAPPGKVLNSQG
jgi:hypothetical protein